MDENLPTGEDLGAHEPLEPVLSGGAGGGATDTADENLAEDLASALGVDLDSEDSGTEKPGAKGAEEGNRGNDELLQLFGLGGGAGEGGDDEFAEILEGTKGPARERIQGLISQVMLERKQSAGYLRILESVGARGEGKPSGDDDDGKDKGFKPIPIEQILTGMNLGEGEDADALRADLTKLSPFIQQIAAAQSAPLLERFEGLQLFAGEMNTKATQSRVKEVLEDRWNPTMQKQVKQVWNALGSPPGMDTAQGIILMAQAVDSMTGAGEQRGKGKGRLDAVQRARRQTLGAGAGVKPGNKDFATGSILTMSDTAFERLDRKFDDD